MSEKVYRKITDEIIRKLEEGVVPWRKPWGDGGDGLGPRNLVSKRAYRGINTFLLSCQGWSSPWWMPYKQAKDDHIKAMKDASAAKDDLMKENALRWASASNDL